MDVLGDRGGDDLLRREPDALVDDLEAGVAGAYGDLLGAVGVPVETGLADQQPQPAAQLLAGRPDALADGGQLGARLGDADRAADAGRGAVLAEDLAQGAGPLPRGRARAGGDQGRRPSGWRRSWRPRPARPAPRRPRPRRARPSTPRRSARAVFSASGSAAMIAPSRSAVSGDGSVVS